MEEIHIEFPVGINLSYRGLELDLSKPLQNIISIKSTDYIPYFLNNDIPGNKGSNGLILKLIESDNWNEDEGYPEVPDLVLKLSKEPLRAFEKNRSRRFKIEIEALLKCNERAHTNTISVFHHGVAAVKSTTGKFSKHRFYSMEFAESDLATYLEVANPSFLKRVELCLEISESLRAIWSEGYYHRDIKPDNILIADNTWKIGDLGLVDHRELDFKIDKRGEWIGPRGWQSPESLNKFLTEGRSWEGKYDCRIDHQSDLYQLGKLMWFIMQGNSPEGAIKRRDFYIRQEAMYQLIITLLNHNKKSRLKSINEVIQSLKRIYKDSLTNEYTYDLY